MLFLRALFDKLAKALKREKRVSQKTLDFVLKDWQEIEVLLKGQSVSQYKQALILADRSMDSILKELTKGKNMGERLKNAKNLFSKEVYSNVWKAHKIRNLLVHESGFEVSGFMIKDAVNNIKLGLTELGIKL